MGNAPAPASDRTARPAMKGAGVSLLYTAEASKATGEARPPPAPPAALAVALAAAAEAAARREASCGVMTV